MKYIVLLRGINISGKNKIVMSKLKLELENLGYKDVITYLNRKCEKFYGKLVAL